jgi:photosystem II stability/assembly factor-like uncharacterized protein
MKSTFLHLTVLLFLAIYAFSTSEASASTLDGNDYYLMQFVNSSTGWVVGVNGLIRKTTDGGATWADQNSGISTDLYSLSFVDTETGWVGGLGGIILNTTNGGRTWAQQHSGIQRLCRAVQFIDALHGWMVCDSGVILSTTNGGTSWTRQSSPTTTTLNSVAFTSAENGCISADNGVMLRTTNGGATWTSAKVDTTLNLWGIAFGDAMHGCIVGSDLNYNSGYVFTTTDGGGTWKQGNTNLSPLFTVQLFSNNSGWATGRSGSVYKTTDGGNTWTSAFTSIPYWLSLSGFVDMTTGWVSDPGGHLMKTTNGGASWPTESFIPTVINYSPQNLSATPGNSFVSLQWNKTALPGFLRYRIYGGTSLHPTTKMDSTTNGINDTTKTFVDLTNGVTYYFRVTAVDSTGVETPFSNEVNATPSARPPHAANLQDVYQPNAGRAATVVVDFSSSGSYSPDGTIDSVFWFVNGILVSRQEQLAYNFVQGTNHVKLVVQDNFGAKDSSSATITISMFKSFFNGPVYAGPSLLGHDVLYAIGTGDALYRLDTSGNILYSLQVNGDVKSSSSIAYDTTVYIASSDKNLYGFSKYGTELWPPLAMGGALNSTSVVDSVTNSLYIGVANKSLVAVDKSTGSVSWNYFADAPIMSSAAITPDRKLVFATVKGTVYGFDLDHPSNPPAPAWEIPLYDSIYSSPAVDNEGFTYFCTMQGKVYKISMAPSQPASIVWQAQTGGAITGSPVIDGSSNLYVGCGDSKLYDINIGNGNIKWAYQSGSPIFSTPAVSEIGMIYFGNHGGKVVALDSSAAVHWYYQDSASVDAPLLYDQGILYVGTVGGRLLALYDNADSGIVAAGARNTHLSKSAIAINTPVWGTFHGNNQRTGVSDWNIVTKVIGTSNPLPNEYCLMQNYPNPFNPMTTISYGIPTRSHVTLSVFNILGQIVAELVAGEKEPGSYTITFDASGLASGVYLYRIQAGNFVQTRKLVLLK